MTDFLKKFERFVTGALILLLAVVILLAVVDLVWILILDVLKPPLFILEIRDLLEIFGLFLLVLIGLELLDTVKSYYLQGRIELKVVFTVALIALGRKIIVLEPEKYTGLTLIGIGIGVIILALVAGYFVVATKVLEFRRDRTKPPPPGEVIWTGIVCCCSRCWVHSPWVSVLSYCRFLAMRKVCKKWWPQKPASIF